MLVYQRVYYIPYFFRELLGGPIKFLSSQEFIWQSQESGPECHPDFEKRAYIHTPLNKPSLAMETHIFIFDWANHSSMDNVA
jgi:hypothetical protein